MINYNPADWYWSGTPVGYSSPIIYGSARGALVSDPSTDDDYRAWLSFGRTPTSWPMDQTGAVTVAALDAELSSAGLPITGLVPLTQAQLLAYAYAKVITILSTPRSYTISGLSGQVVDDCGGQTAIDMNATFVQLSGLTYPFEWSDDNYTVWSMTQDELTAFLTASFTYASSVWAMMNGTAIPEIKAGTITTKAQIDALSWPA